MVVAAFEDAQQAANAIGQLQQSGIDPSYMSVVTQYASKAYALGQGSHGPWHGTSPENLTAVMRQHGASSDDLGAYLHAISVGGAVVIVARQSAYADTIAWSCLNAYPTYHQRSYHETVLV